ncbi:MAG: hypothetical protein IJK23_10930 [Clostridia bacterium]|nr:hypothetical protein [Clostridia bacterium]
MKQRMKKTLALLLGVMLALTVFAPTAFADLYDDYEPLTFVTEAPTLPGYYIDQPVFVNLVRGEINESNLLSMIATSRFYIDPATRIIYQVNPQGTTVYDKQAIEQTLADIEAEMFLGVDRERELVAANRELKIASAFHEALIKIDPVNPNGAWRVGDLIEFGGYPQAQVTDADTVAALDALDKTWVSYGYYSGTDNEYDGNMVPGDWMRYADVLYNGARYRAVTFDSYRSYCTGYASYAAYSYQDNYGYEPGNTYYFQFESLQWRVLDPAAGLVLCERIIDSQAYQNVIYKNGSEYYQGIGSSVYANDYATSSIRSWLNDDFYNTAFSEAEKALIAGTVLDNSAFATWCSQYDSASTTDKIFLLSYGDARNTAYGFSSNGARYAKGTDYAKCQGLYVTTSSSYRDNSNWRLRSPGSLSRGAAIVSHGGDVEYLDHVDYVYEGVRPAFQFKSGITESVNPNGSWRQVGDLIEFGGYPQSRVTDADTVAALDALDKTWVSYDYYSGTGDRYDGKMIPGDWMRYADVLYDGARYRAVTFDAYRPYLTDYSISNAWKSYQDENGYEPGNTYYFQFESLQWRVLDPAAGLVLCESIIDAQAYQNTVYKNGSAYYQGIGSDVYANDYTTSSIRSWLNEDFYNTAFSEAEKALIAETVLDNSAVSTEYSQYDSASTTDKIFLLSYGDAMNTAYRFNSDRNVFDTAKCAQGTDYAKCQGLYVSTSSSSYGNSYWWLRSPGYNSSAATCVESGGNVNVSYIVHGTDNGVRPAFHFRSGITESVNPNGSWRQVGELIEFGGYPQSRVTDADTVAALDALEKTWVSYGYYSGTGSQYDGKMLPGDWMRYADLLYNGARYRAVTFDGYRPSFTGNFSDASNSFQDDNGYEPGNTYYFKFESLQWRVLDPAAGLVLCESIIDSQAYQNVIYKNGSEYYQGIGSSVYANNYAKSSIRSWLNDDFYNTAFSEAEKALIAETVLDNSAYEHRYDSASTTDKIFLLSCSDALNTAYGFSSDNSEKDTARCAQGTDYAKCQGLWVSTNSSSYGNSYWRLRSPGSYSNCASYVYYNGSFSYNYNVNYTHRGVRPAFQFKSGITESVNPNGSWRQVGELIEFGGYPQTQVTDADTVAALDALEKNWVSYGYYSGTGSMYDGNMVPGDWMRYADVLYDGARYRAVTFDAYRPYYTGYIANTSNNYQDNNGYEPGNTYYFKFESLQWRVLDPGAGLVLCEKIIDSQAYQNVVYRIGPAYYQGHGSDVYANDYATSSIRSWLNDDFYNTAFSEAEKTLIAGTALDNSAYSTSYSQYDSASTTDKIFLLSYGDAVNTAYGFSSDSYEEDTARCAQGTDYAKCQGLWVSTSSSTYGNSYWWLRSPGSYSNYATDVYGGGDVSGGYDVGNTYEGVRPAFRFQSEITESVNPNGYCEAGAPEETVITPAGCGSAGEKKITVTCALHGETLSETTEPIPATGEHVWKWVVDTPATCGAAGKKHQECENCDATQNENTEIEATGEHVWKWVVDEAATCGKAGVKHQACENCDAVQAENTAIDLTGAHVWKWVVDVEPTCGVAGKKHQECENCDAVQAENTEIEATGEHVWKWVVDKAATCGKAGVKHQECENCDATQAEGTAIPATGDHVTKRQGAKAATETEDGYTGDLVCTVCGKLIKKGTVIPATGADTTVVSGKPHGERCVCYDITGDSLFANIMRFICATLCFIWAMQEALGV